MMTFKKLLTLALLASVTLNFSACSILYGEKGFFRGKEKDYLKTGQIKEMTVPEGISSPTFEPIYAIPKVYSTDEFGDRPELEDYVVPRPSAINIDKSAVGAKIQKLGAKRWIFLDAPTSQIWPRTQNFLSELGITVEYNNPREGIIDTTAITYKDDRSTHSRFRIKLEKGIHPDTTEVHIVHMQYSADQAPDTQFEWPEASHDTQKEADLLNDLASVLIENLSNNSASLMGQNVGGSLKVEFLSDSNEPIMRLRLSRNRAFATLSHSLKKDGFVLWEESPDQGLFYIGYQNTDKKGLLSRWFGKKISPDNAPDTLANLLQKMPRTAETKSMFPLQSTASSERSDSAKTDAEQGFIAVLKRNDKVMDFVIRDTNGNALEREQAKALLRLVRKNLI
ncbi:MAG: NlpB/DapX lipoprotein [Alteromonadaceae bacterium]|nr:MAG: NlpB/DapX lipoprotein [Alteromonadaceae bacterium]